MNIIFVFDGLQFGGIERVGIEYIKLLNSKNYTIKVVNLRSKYTALEKEIPAGIDVLHIPFPRGLAPQRYSKLVRMMPGGSLVFHVCGFLVNIVQKIYKLQYQKKVPKADLAIAFSGHYNDLTFINENYKNAKKIAWLHGDETSYNNIAPGYFELYRKIKNLICLSEKNDDESSSFNKQNGINKVLIYNPINLRDRIIDKELVINLKQAYGDYILMVGRMEKDKDQATLIRSLYHLKEKYNLKKKLVLVGDGAEREVLEKIVKDMKLENQVFFVGARYDVQNYYAGASVYAHSSPAEGLPTVLLEAMYYNIPIATTDSKPGVREILRADCGLITPVGDAEALADSIYKLYTDKKLVAELNVNCQERVKDFLPEHIMTQFEEYIKTIQ